MLIQVSHRSHERRFVCFSTSPNFARPGTQDIPSVVLIEISEKLAEL